MPVYGIQSPFFSDIYSKVILQGNKYSKIHTVHVFPMMISDRPFFGDIFRKSCYAQIKILK